MGKLQASRLPAFPAEAGCNVIPELQSRAWLADAPMILRSETLPVQP